MRRAGAKIRVTAELIAPETGEQLWTGRYDRDIGDLFAMQDEITTNLSAAIATEIVRAEASAPARLSDRRQRLGPLPQGAVALLPADQGGSDRRRRAVPGGHPARSPAVDRARLSRHDPDPEHPVRLGQGHAGDVGRGDEPGRDQRPARPALLLRVLDPVLGPRHGGASRGARWTPPSARSRSTPTTCGARGVLGICHFVIGEHREAIELFSMAAQRDNSDPALPMGGAERLQPLSVGAI